MREDVHMPRKKRRSFTVDQKADAVRLARELGNVSEAARDLGITPGSIHAWLRQADIDEGRGPDGALTSAEKEEFRQLKRENKVLRQERDFLKKAAAFFARDEDQPSS